MKPLEYEITEEFSKELLDISELLKKLKNNNVYEISHLEYDGSLRKNIEKLEGLFADLLSKIQNGKGGFERSLSAYFGAMD